VVRWRVETDQPLVALTFDDGRRGLEPVTVSELIAAAAPPSP
jgi:hypothetical protein